MIIAHIPAGYITSKLIFRYFKDSGAAYSAFLWAGVIGAHAPDFDMVYYYFVDHRQHHHHTYWTHIPIVWLGLVLFSLTWFQMARNRGRASIAVIFSLNGMVHLLLDTIAGDIWWLAPFIKKSFALVTVPALYRPWWLNFLVHWTFMLELVAVAWAAYLWKTWDSPPGDRRDRNKLGR